MHPHLRQSPAERTIFSRVDAMADAIRLQTPHDLIDRFGPLLLSGVDRDTEAALLGALEQRRVLGVAKIRSARAGDVDAHDPPITVFQSLFDDDLVLLVGKLPVETE